MEDFYFFVTAYMINRLPDNPIWYNIIDRVTHFEHISKPLCSECKTKLLMDLDGKAYKFLSITKADSCAIMACYAMCHRCGR